MILFLLSAGCANKVAPLGGDKDVKPPVITSIQPPNRTLNLTKGEIEISFDEYVQLKEAANQIFISPVMNPAPGITIRKKSIFISLPDSLRANTTYTINFGNSIADVNEGNKLPGLQYVFSTGNNIDSLKVKGRVLNARTRQPEKNVLAILYTLPVGDSVFLKKTPDYFARTSENGTFEINNVSKNSYRVFALNDKNNNYLLDPADEEAGFISETLNLTDSAEVILNIARQQAFRQVAKNAVITDAGRLLTVFSRPLSNESWSFVYPNPDSLLYEYSSERDSVMFYFKATQYDSVKVIWKESNIVIDTVTYQKPRELVLKTQQVRHTGWGAIPQRGESLLPEKNPVINWFAPIVKFDLAKFSVFRDSLALPFEIKFTDSLKTHLEFISEWREGAYSIKIFPGGVTDWNNFSNDSVALNFSIPGEREKGSISINFTSGKQSKLILQLVSEKDELIRHRQFTTRLKEVFERIDPGIYKFRVIEDLNGNGKWDSGNFATGIQPEPVYYYPESVTVRANWDVEVQWTDK